VPSFSLGEIMSMATQNAGRRSDISASIVSQRANVAYFMVAHDADHALTEKLAVSSTTSGENRIDLPADFGDPISVSLRWSWSTASSAVSNTKRLTVGSVSDFDASGFYPAGEPQQYAIYNNWLELYPSPNSAYSLDLRYRSVVTDMSNTTDVPSVSTNYRYAIVIKTTQLLHEYLGNWAGAAALNNQYIDFMARQKSDAARRQSDENRMGVAVVTRFSNPQRRTTGDFQFETDWQS
jgi:hypothetical protein